jgi:hypothetical protein
MHCGLAQEYILDLVILPLFALIGSLPSEMFILTGFSCVMCPIDINILLPFVAICDIDLSQNVSSYSPWSLSIHRIEI